MHRDICTGTYAEVHMQRYICTGTYAQVHMLRYICRGTYAEGHMHRYICTGTYAEVHMQRDIYTGTVGIKKTFCCVLVQRTLNDRRAQHKRKKYNLETHVQRNACVLQDAHYAPFI